VSTETPTHELSPAGPCAPPTQRRGFTLIELLVAIALMTILTGSVVFIFIQSQKIFATVDARVQVYQYARYAFDRMERDLANVVRTTDMEFFDDLKPPAGVLTGHYDNGEEIPIRGAEDADSIYNHSFTLRQPEKYTDIVDELQYRHDSIYFRTVTEVGDETTSVLVEYALEDSERERPKMQRRQWRVTGVDNGNPLRPRYEINGTTGNQAQPEVSDLCLYTMECRFRLFVLNRRYNQPPRYYSCEELINPPAWPGAPSYRSFEPMRNYAQAPDQMIQTFYDERWNPTSFQPDLLVFKRSENQDSDMALCHTANYFSFPMLSEGDSILLHGGGLPTNAQRLYRINAFVHPDGQTPWEPGDPVNQMRIQLDESIEFPRSLGSGQDMQLLWRAAWLPPALEVTFKIKDSKSLELRTVQRVFKIIGSN
jgi:prepilin-type N-terminal cleavage/methylation domain-containing protein